MSSDGGAEVRRRAVQPLVVFEFGSRSSAAFGRVVGRLQEAGTPIGDMDALIASVCLVAGHPVLTRNTAHFALVPGLTVETY